jgi:hypothetical protein
MRVLWVDADENPWTELNGWRVLEDFGVALRRVSTVAEARQEPPDSYDLALVRVELPEVQELLVELRSGLGNSGRKIVLASSEWNKEQFRSHSKTTGAAHRYARVPMPPVGFLNLLAELFGCTVEELAEFRATPEGEEAGAPMPKRARLAGSPTADSGDLDVLRKYLAIREEQLGIAEGERGELAKENVRLQKEAVHLRQRLREFESLQSDLSKKIRHMEEEKAEAERRILQGKEEAERNGRMYTEKLKELEARTADSGEKYESLRARVRKDIRKIRENERDLEARLELMRKDSETLLRARDQKVLDLQRKIDAIEFDLDQVQDSRVQAQIEAERYLAKLSRVSRALQIATHMIEDDRSSDTELEELEPLSGGAANAEEPKPALEAAAPGEPAAAAEPPPGEEGEAESGESAASLSPELAALANDGEATQMISSDGLQKLGGEPGSSG